MTQSTFSIGIVTYEDRFNQWFKPLLDNIKSILPEVEVLVQVNANFKTGLDEEYRKQMLQFCSSHPKVYPFFWTNFRALSKLWNNCLVNSSNNHVLILNDDLVIQHPIFFAGVLEGIKKFEGRTFKINDSWSHFLANREEIEAYHWFDEQLLGVGNEDGDMQLRIEQRTGQPMPNHGCAGILNIVSYQNPLPGVKKIARKYSEFNHYHFLSKIDLSQMTEKEKKEYWVNRDKIPTVELPKNAYPHEKFWWENKDKLGE